MKLKQIIVLSVIFGILALGILLKSWVRSSGDNMKTAHGKDVVFAKFDPEKLERILISRGDRSPAVELAKENGVWKVKSLWGAKADPGKLSLGGSGLNSANHAANERMNAAFGVKTTYIPFKGTGDMTTSVLGGHVDGAMTYTAFAVNNKGKVRALAVAMDKRHPLLPDTPTFKELGVDWVDGAYRGIAMPKSSTPEQRKRVSDLWAVLNNDPEMKELAAKSGFELINVGTDGMDKFMAEKIRVYTGAAKQMGLGK